MYQNNNAGQEVAAPETPIESTMKELHQAIDVLGNSIEAMLRRAQSVCKPDSPTPVGSTGQITPADPIRSPLAGDIARQIRAVRDFTQRIEYTLGRIEI